MGLRKRDKLTFFPLVKAKDENISQEDELCIHNLIPNQIKTWLKLFHSHSQFLTHSTLSPIPTCQPLIV